MHEGVDFLYEAVINSFEAQARQVFVEYTDSDDVVNVTVTDDGILTEDISWFGKGVSSKGSHRGQGLSLLKEKADGNAWLFREGNYTKLHYQMKKNGSYGTLYSILPLLFQRVGGNQRLEFKFIRGEEVKVLDSSDFEAPEEIQTLIKIRKIIQDWEFK